MARGRRKDAFSVMLANGFVRFIDAEVDICGVLRELIWDGDSVLLMVFLRLFQES